MLRLAKRAIVLGLGWLFILLGFAGLFLPVLQGILFLLIGVILLSYESVTVRRFMNRTRERYPVFASAFDRAEERARRVFRRTTGDDDDATA